MKISWCWLFLSTTAVVGPASALRQLAVESLDVEMTVDEKREQIHTIMGHKHKEADQEAIDLLLKTGTLPTLTISPPSRNTDYLLRDFMSINPKSKRSDKYEVKGQSKNELMGPKTVGEESLASKPPKSWDSPSSKYETTAPESPIIRPLNETENTDPAETPRTFTSLA